jgi:hypothetical protein
MTEWECREEVGKFMAVSVEVTLSGSHAVQFDRQ